MPYNVFLLGLIILFFKLKPVRLKRLAGGLIFAFYLCSNSYVVGMLSSWWACAPPAAPLHRDGPRVGVVLSGGIFNTCTANPERMEVGENVSRLYQAFRLYREGTCDQLIISGTDSEALLATGNGEIQKAASVLEEWGVPRESITLELRARNTRENALYTAEILRKNEKLAPVALITSDFHMHRAKACFEKAGVAVYTFPSDAPFDIDCLSLKRKLLPDPRALAHFQKLWREWVGMAMYKLAGYC